MTLRYDEMFISVSQLARLAVLAASTNTLAGDAVEIGVHQGRSAIPLAEAIYPATLHAVDDWSAIDLAPDARARDNRAVFLANIEAAVCEGHRGRIVVHSVGWREWWESWTGQLRFAHIDAHHTEKEVCDTIAALRPYVVPGGIIAGDDWGKPPVAAGVLRNFHAQSVSTHEDLWWSYA